MIVFGNRFYGILSANEHNANAKVIQIFDLSKRKCYFLLKKAHFYVILQKKLVNIRFFV